MYPILRNLISVIRRFKLAAALNILGLSVAFAAFMIIMIQLDYDFNYSKCHKDYDKIFRVEATDVRRDEVMSRISRPQAEHFFNSSPHILVGALAGWKTETFFTVEREVEERLHRNGYTENQLLVSPEFFDVFSFDFVEGSDARIAPRTVFIPLSLSRKFFGNEPAVGKQIIHEGGWGTQTVAAVYRDFPENTIVDNCIYFAMNPNENLGMWANVSYRVYIRVNSAKNAPLLIDNFKRVFDAKAEFGDSHNYAERFQLRLTPLKDIHFITDVKNDETSKANKQTLLILFAIAMTIITIAVINFTNFSTALTPMRVRNINTQRVMGAQQRTIRWAIVCEAVFFSLVSVLVAIFFFLWFKGSLLANLVDGDLSLASRPLLVGGTALIALLVGLFAGIYPAYYMTSFEPALVIKGSFGLSPKGKQIRNTLIGIQYAASFLLIVGASFMYLQNRFMLSSPLGFDKDALITVNTQQISGRRDAFTHKLKEYAGIEDVVYSDELLSSENSNDFGWGRGNGINFSAFIVQHSFLKTVGIEVTEGRDILPDDIGLGEGGMIFNETARKKYDLKLGDYVGGEIIGFVPDIKFRSFHNEVAPMAFWMRRQSIDYGTLNIAYIKVKGGTNKRAAMTYVKNTLSEFNPSYNFEVRFYDEILQHLYEKEIVLNILITLFSLIAILISIVGVFGLVVFDNEYRRKEIGIRKINGATTAEILLLFNRGYFRILAICFVIAAPIAWYAVNRWLENFAYKTPLYWWVFLLAFIVVAAITLCTVTFQSWRTANENPVEAIRSSG
jgi:putative ABC transport system permease protein